MLRLRARVLQEYTDRVEAVAHAAGDAAVRMYDAMRVRNLNAPIADIRDETISIVDSVVAAYGDAACEAAAQMYDAMAADAGRVFPPATIPEMSDETRAEIEGTVRRVVGFIVETESRSDI